MEKRFLTVKQAAELMQYKPSYLYKMIMGKNRRLPIHKPNGGRVYILESDCIAYMQGVRFGTKSEIEQQASDYCQERAV